MHGCMNLNRVRIPLSKALYRRLPTMGRAIVGDPKNAAGRAIGFALHHEVHQATVGGNAGGGFTTAKKFRVSDIPCGQVGQGATPLVLKFYAPCPPWSGRRARGDAFSGLDTCFLVGANDVIRRPQGVLFPDSVIQIKDAASFLGELWVAWPEPTSLCPRSDGIGTQPPPNRRATDGGRNALTHGLSGNLGVREARKRYPPLRREFASQCLDLHDDLRGKKSEAARASVGLGVRPSVRRRIVSATWRQSVAGEAGARQSPCSPFPRRRRGPLLYA